MEEQPKHISFAIRMINNQIKDVVMKSIPKTDKAPQSHLQGGIMGYLYHHREEAVYQKDIERVFRISGATATNTLRVMEKNGLIMRKNQDKDARLKRITLTEEAEAGHAKVEAHMQKMDECIVKGLTEAEIEKLGQLLGKVRENLDAMQQECNGNTAER